MVGRFLSAACVVATLAASPALAATVYLKSGGTMTVDAWRRVDGEIEISVGGGLMRIPEADVERIEGGTPATGDLPLARPPSPRGPGSRPAAPGGEGEVIRVAQRLARLASQVSQAMNEVLAGIARSGRGRGPSLEEATGSFHAQARAWRELRVPEALGEAHRQGVEVLEAFEQAALARDVQKMQAEALAMRFMLPALQLEASRAWGRQHPEVAGPQQARAAGEMIDVLERAERVVDHPTMPGPQRAEELERLSRRWDEIGQVVGGVCVHMLGCTPAVADLVGPHLAASSLLSMARSMAAAEDRRWGDDWRRQIREVRAEVEAAGRARP